MDYLYTLFNHKTLIFWLSLGVIVLLSGCVNRPLATQSDGVQSNLSDNRSDLTLADLKSWCLNGRSVVRYHDSGWQASIRWCVDNDKLTLEISGPININRVFIRYLNGELWLQESNSEVTISHSPQQLLQSKLGFSVPLSAIRYWLLGQPKPGSSARVQVNEEGNIEQIIQMGWTVMYSRFQAVKQFKLPRKIKINKDQMRLKIVIDEWELS